MSCDSNFSLILLLVSVPAPSALGLRSVAAKFVTLAAPSGRVAVPHTAAAAVGPVAPEVDAVAGAGDFAAAVVSYLLLRLHPRLPLHYTWSVRKVSDLWPGKINCLTCCVGHLITLKVVPLGLHTLLPAVPPLLEACRKSLFRNGV